MPSFNVDPSFTQNQMSQGQSPATAQQFMASSQVFPQNQLFTQVQYPQMMTSLHMPQQSNAMTSVPQMVMSPSVFQMAPGQNYFNLVPQQMGIPQQQMGNPQMNLQMNMSQFPLQRCSSDDGSSVSSGCSSTYMMPTLSAPVIVPVQPQQVNYVNGGMTAGLLEAQNQVGQPQLCQNFQNLALSNGQVNMNNQVQQLDQNLRILPRSQCMNASPRSNEPPMMNGDPAHGWGNQRRHVPMVHSQHRYRRNPRTRSKKKYGYRSKQNKIEMVKGNLEHKFGTRGILVPQDSLLRGNTVVRVHVKKYEPLCKIEEALSMIDNHPDIEICRISLPVSMKNPFQMKGFLVYVQVKNLIQVQLTQTIFRLFDEFQKCEVALQSSQSNHVKSNNAAQPQTGNAQPFIEKVETTSTKEMEKQGSIDEDGTYYAEIFNYSDGDSEAELIIPGMLRKHSSVAAA